MSTTTVHEHAVNEATVHFVGYGIEVDLMIGTGPNQSAVFGGIPDHSRRGGYSLAYRGVPFGAGRQIDGIAPSALIHSF